jgi:hypothetical protein
MREVDKAIRSIQWKFITSTIVGHERDIERITKKYHPPRE